MKSKILLILTFGALVIAGGCYAYYKNFVELSTEYYTVKVVVPSEYDEEYSYKTGVEVKVETTIPRKHQYISYDEAVKAEQNYADGFRETTPEAISVNRQYGFGNGDGGQGCASAEAISPNVHHGLRNVDGSQTVAIAEAIFFQAQ